MNPKEKKWRIDHQHPSADKKSWMEGGYFISGVNDVGGDAHLLTKEPI